MNDLTEEILTSLPKGGEFLYHVIDNQLLHLFHMVFNIWIITTSVYYGV